MPPRPEQDHRARVGADRRARTRYRLIEAAIPVFATKGVDAPVIDDVIRMAGVSRGTFYNHFRTNQDLLLAVTEQLRDELVQTSRQTVTEIADPAGKIAVAIGLLIGFAKDVPLVAQFVARVGLEAAGPERLLGGMMGGLISDGIAAGRLPQMPVQTALDMVAGTVLFALYRISRNESSGSHGGEVIAFVLQGLGLPPEEAAQLSATPVPPMRIPPDCALLRHVAAGQAQRQG